MKTFCVTVKTNDIKRLIKLHQLMCKEQSVNGRDCEIEAKIVISCDNYPENIIRKMFDFEEMEISFRNSTTSQEESSSNDKVKDIQLQSDCNKIGNIRKLQLPEPLESITDSANSLEESIHLLAVALKLEKKENLLEATIKAVLELEKVTWKNIEEVMVRKGRTFSSYEKMVIFRAISNRLHERGNNEMSPLDVLKQISKLNRATSKDCATIPEETKNEHGKASELQKNETVEVKDQYKAGEPQKKEGAEVQGKYKAEEQLKAKKTQHKSTKKIMPSMPEIPEFIEFLKNMDKNMTNKNKAKAVIEKIDKTQAISINDKVRIIWIIEVAISEKEEIEINDIMRKSPIPKKNWSNTRYEFSQAIKRFIESETGNQVQIRVEDFLNYLRKVIGE